MTVDRMQELLEAERAGVRSLSTLADQASPGDKKEFLLRLRRDEGRFCMGLYRLIEARGAEPNERVGAFAEKVAALPTEAEKLALLIKGQAWVVRKIDELPADELNAAEKAFFAAMREDHLVNIEACRKYLP